MDILFKSFPILPLDMKAAQQCGNQNSGLKPLSGFRNGFPGNLKWSPRQHVNSVVVNV